MTTDKKQTYISQISKLTKRLEQIYFDSSDELSDYQAELDSLAQTYQDDESIGTERYLLYHAQALIHWHSGDYETAIMFMEDAINTRNTSYKFAEDLIQTAERKIEEGSTNRIDRSTFFISHVCNTVILLLLMLVWGILTSSISEQGSDVESAAVSVIGLLIIVPFAAYAIGITVLRLRDLNQSWVYALVMLIPGANLLLFLILATLPGTFGRNQYGYKPLNSVIYVPFAY